MKLTERHLELLRAIRYGAVTEISGEYYRLGGHGHVNVRYHRATLPNMARAGLVRRDGSIYYSTDAGLSALESA
jgi:hypothetical protein